MAAHEHVTLSGVKRHCAQTGSVYRLLRGPTRTPCLPLDIHGDHYPFHYVSQATNELYVGLIREARIFSRSDVVLAGRGTALLDLVEHPMMPYVVMNGDPRVLRLDGANMTYDAASQRVARLDRAIMLSGMTSGRFGHWVSEFVPKLRLFGELPELREWPIVVDENMPAAHYEMLRLIAGAEREYFSLPPGVELQVDTLAVAPTFTFKPHNLTPEAFRQSSITEITCDPEALQYFKQTCSERLGLNGSGGAGSGRRIFISRRNSSFRLLANEAEIIQALADEGFETVYPEEMSFAEQARLFHSAQCVVGPNGSAFNNIVFSPASSRAVMLFGPDMANWPGWLNAAASLGHRITCLCGPAANPGPASKHTDYVVPPGELLRLLSPSRAAKGAALP